MTPEKRSRRRVLALGLLLLVGGCRDFRLDGDPPHPLGEPPPPPKRTRGVPCDDGGQCESGLCVTGVCCLADCSATQRCNAPASLGLCIERKGGDGCTADLDCPTGHCADKVCCDQACGANCLSCVNPGAEGTCQRAIDGADVRNECGTCAACFGGYCAPAILGTNPKGLCAAGLSCGPGSVCRPAGGSKCDRDDQCAGGECIAGTCLAYEITEVSEFALNRDAKYRAILDLSLDTNGNAAVLFTEEDGYSDSRGDYFRVEFDLFLALKSGAGWALHRISHNDDQAGFPSPGALEQVGSWLYLATFAWTNNETMTCGTVGKPPCGVYGEYFAASGEHGGTEEIDKAVRGVLWVDLTTDAAGALVAAYSDGKMIFLKRRDPVTRTWSSRVEFGTDIGIVDFTSTFSPPRLFSLKSGVAVLYRASSSPFLRSLVYDRNLKLLANDKLPDVIGPVHGQCTPTRITGEPSASAGVDELTFGYRCDWIGRNAEVLFGTYRPSAPVASRWTTEFLPFSALDPIQAVIPLRGVPGALPMYVEPVSSADAFADFVQLAWRSGTGWATKPTVQFQGQVSLDDTYAVSSIEGLPVLATSTNSPVPGRGSRLFVIRFHK